MSTTPVLVEVRSPATFDRTQLLLRVLISIALGWLGITAGFLTFGLYLLLPVIAAVSISVGAERFRADVAPRIAAVIAWLLQFWAYMMLLTDRFPAGVDTARIELPVTGRPTVGSALWRLVTSLPSGVVLVVLWFVSSVLWLIAAITVLVGARVPSWYAGYQRGVLRWQARLVAYHASLVDEYPPFDLDTGEHDHTATLVASEAR